MSRPLIAILATLEGHPEPDPDAATGEAQSATGTWDLRHVTGGAYVAAVRQAGGLPILLPCLAEGELVRDVLGRTNGLVITGGADVAPEDYGAERSLRLGKVNVHRDALDRLAVVYAQDHPDLPVLAICRGIQAYNVYAGGTLIQDIPSEVGEQVAHSQGRPAREATHEVAVEAPDSRVAEIVGCRKVMVNSFHHQAVRDVAPGLRVVARAVDGVIEALERPEARWCVLVQWHPEHMVADHDHARRLFEAFVAACRS